MSGRHLQRRRKGIDIADGKVVGGREADVAVRLDVAHQHRRPCAGRLQRHDGQAFVEGRQHKQRRLLVKVPQHDLLLLPHAKRDRGPTPLLLAAVEVPQPPKWVRQFHAR